MRLSKTFFKKKIKGDVKASSHPLVVREVDNLNSEIGSAEVLKSSKYAEGFQHGPGNGKFLKHCFP